MNRVLTDAERAWLTGEVARRRAAQAAMIETPPGWKRRCPTCREDVVAFSDNDLTCSFCGGRTRALNSKHGTAARYSNQGCRCVKCCDAHAARVRGYRKRRAARPAPAHVHGTGNGYRNYGCRCEACTEAAMAEWRAWKRDGTCRKAVPVTPRVRLKHGETGYQRGCRCAGCRDGHAAYRRRERARNKAA